MFGAGLSSDGLLGAIGPDRRQQLADILEEGVLWPHLTSTTKIKFTDKDFTRNTI